jgi:hypothetical protein
VAVGIKSYASTRHMLGWRGKFEHLGGFTCVADAS